MTYATLIVELEYEKELLEDIIEDGLLTELQVMEIRTRISILFVRISDLKSLPKKELIVEYRPTYNIVASRMNYNFSLNGRKRTKVLQK